MQRFRFYFILFFLQNWARKLHEHDGNPEKNNEKTSQTRQLKLMSENETKVRTGNMVGVFLWPVEGILSNDHHYHVRCKCHVCERIMKCNHLLNGIINEFRARSITWTSGREINPGADDDDQEKIILLWLFFADKHNFPLVTSVILSIHYDLSDLIDALTFSGRIWSFYSFWSNAFTIRTYTRTLVLFQNNAIISWAKFFPCKIYCTKSKSIFLPFFFVSIERRKSVIFSPTNFSQHLTVISRTPNTGFEQSNATLFAVWGWRIGFSAKGTRQTNWKIRFGLIFSIFPDAETLPDGQGTICWEVLGV